ncbi:MAG: radical SAM protein [Chloroflexi bacterium]|nr:radical SAM protein [Chloroflexota bacterium]
MLGVSRLLCGTVTATDHLRYGSRNDGTPRPVVVWTATRRCNLHCIHCYADSANRRYPGELTTAEAEALLDDLADFGVPVLLLSGGEPLLRHDLFAQVEHAHRRGIHTTLSTNGTLITPDVARRIRDTGFGYVGISLDGIGTANDRFRGHKGAFEAALAGIRNCLAVGQRVGLRLTLTRHTIADLDAIFDLVEQEGIQRVCFYHLVYSGRGRRLAADDLSPLQTRAALDRIFRKVLQWHAKGRAVEVLTVDNHADAPYLWLWLRAHNPERAAAVYALLRRNGGNRSGIAIGHVDNLGVVHPDQFWWQCSLGSVRERSFSAIWSDTRHPVLAALRERPRPVGGRCAQCRFAELCNGNFRARALAVYDDAWAEDPACYLTDEECRPDDAAARTLSRGA